VRIVVPFGAGSTPDIVARLVAEGLQQKYPTTTFVVENKPGASGNLGTDAVAKAAPDGSTIGVSIGGPLAINTLLFAKLPYDPHKDIVPITQLVTQPSVLAVNPGLGINSVAELVSLLKKNPGKYNFASIGNGSLSDVPTLKEAGIDVEADAWNGLIAPGGTPKSVAEKISKDVSEIIMQPAVREKLATQLMEPVGSSPDALRARMDGEIARWAPVIKAANVKIN